MTLKEHITVLKMINESNLENKYEEEVNIFSKRLKKYLYSFFETDVVFEDSKDIKGYYKGEEFSIDLSNGISLNTNNLDLLIVFEPILTRIMGSKKTFSYEIDNGITYEWSFNPEKRIEELSNLDLKKLNDYYTTEMIESLGSQLLSLEGYIQLFSNGDNEVYKITQMQRMYPNLKTSILQSWIASSKSKLSLTK